MKPEVSSMCSLEPATASYPETLNLPHPHTQLLEDPDLFPSV